MPPPSHPPFDPKRYGYLHGVGVAVDQLINAITGGDVDETLSSRLGKRKLKRGGVLVWHDWLGLAKPLDWLLDKVDPGHSLGAIEPDEGEPPRPPSGHDV